MAIILVVLHHAALFALEVSLASHAWAPLTEFLRTMRMPLFFACAGLFATKWVRAPWRELIRSKILLFAWVYVLWLVLRWVWFAIIVNQSIAGAKDVLIRLVWPSEGWFIFVLALLLVIARALRSVPIWVQLAGSAVLSTIWLSGWVSVGNLAWDGIPTYLFFFLAGAHARGQFLRYASRVRWWSALALVAAWIAVYVALAWTGMLDAPGIGFALRIVGLLTGVAIATQLEWWDWLRRLGQATLPIYMMHVLWVAAVIMLVKRFAPGLGAQDWFLASFPLALTVIALAVSRGVDVLAERFGGGWLFATPLWLIRLYDRVWRVPAEAHPRMGPLR